MMVLYCIVCLCLNQVKYHPAGCQQNVELTNNSLMRDILINCFDKKINPQNVLFKENSKYRRRRPSFALNSL
jgi:hypothetical protein